MTTISVFSKAGPYLATCCAALEVELEDVLAYGKDAIEVVRARQVIAWGIRNKFKYSYPRIGKLMARTNCTVWMNVRRVDEALAKGEDWAIVGVDRVKGVELAQRPPDGKGLECGD